MAPVLASFYAGGSVYCTPGFDALRFYQWLSDSQPSWYSAVPTMHQTIVARASRNQRIVAQSSLRFIRSSSASLPTSVLNDLESIFSTPVVEAYAMTEAAHQMCSNPLPPKVRKPGTVGPAAGPEVKISDPQSLEFLGLGQEGEVVIRGESVTSGFLNNPMANEMNFSKGWFRTGDAWHGFSSEGFGRFVREERPKPTVQDESGSQGAWKSRGSREVAKFLFTFRTQTHGSLSTNMHNSLKKAPIGEDQLGP